MERTAILFPGQGSQYSEMGKTLYEEYDIAKKTFEEANDTLGYDLKKICFEGRLSQLNQIENMLPAILTTSVAAFRVYMQEVGITPTYMAGHSLGEFSALTCSGAMEFRDALQIVQFRSNLARNVATEQDAGMTILEGTDFASVEAACQEASQSGKVAQIACVNSSDQFTISGHQDAIEKAEDILVTKGARITPMFMGAPFHSIVMEEASLLLRRELEKITFHTFLCPVISNVTATPYSDTASIIDNLTNQLIKTVQWSSIMEYLEAQKLAAVVEVGPQSILTNLYKNDPKAKGLHIFSFNQKKDKQMLLDILTGKKEMPAAEAPVNQVSLVTRCLRVAISTRNRNWNTDEYNHGVLAPYRKLKEIQQELDTTQAPPTMEQMNEALELLYTILSTKKLPQEEQVHKFNKILSQSGSLDLFPHFVERRFMKNAVTQL
ncbi:ACP S-malonyltransferase [Brevibacillus dissolubilis]|uniref:ACP S-malonyltransferase n=1 Tax=Brevibacillus dissolubilis TaxID=1844116 RepID=UPI001115B99F|nr:ACP S-malonyltransferase [Brevibacillus dissolubilis]